MPRSQSFVEFKAACARAEELLSLEALYPDPPPADKRLAMDALRSGAVVLMVAAVEAYLDAIGQEKVESLRTDSAVVVARLPSPVRVQNAFKTLKLAMEGDPFARSPDRFARLPDVFAACRMIAVEALNPGAFSNGGADSKAVIRVFQQLGHPSPFMAIRTEFDKQWGAPTHDHFLIETLDGIVGARHLAAHTITPIALSRLDVNSHLRFLQTLVEQLDAELEDHVSKIGAAAR